MKTEMDEKKEKKIATIKKTWKLEQFYFRFWLICLLCFFSFLACRALHICSFPEHFLFRTILRFILLVLFCASAIKSIHFNVGREKKTRIDKNVFTFHIQTHIYKQKNYNYDLQIDFSSDELTMNTRQFDDGEARFFVQCWIFSNYWYAVIVHAVTIHTIFSNMLHCNYEKSYKNQ